MKGWLDLVLCRFLGRRCSLRRPASRDLIAEMRSQARRAEAQTIERRRQREDIAATLRRARQGGGT